LREAAPARTAPPPRLLIQYWAQTVWLGAES
jgi:hypothetical protein